MPQGPVNQQKPGDLNVGAIYPQSSNVETLSGNKTVANTDEQVQILDPGGAARDVTLPADEEGLVYEVVNTADAAEDLTVKDSGGTAVATVSQNEAAKFYNTGSGWVCLLGAAATDQDV